MRVKNIGKIFGVFAILALLIPETAADRRAPDLVVLNANIMTMDKNNPRVEAFAVSQGIFIAVGTTKQISNLIGNRTKIIDARRKTITPGFIDAHLHPEPLYPFESIHHRVDLSPKKVKSIGELILALKKKAAITQAGQWIRGINYQDSKLGRHPTLRDLDKVSTKHPIYITHSSGHVFVVNTLALSQAGITKHTRDPRGGAFDRDKKGRLTGICRGRAGAVVSKTGPRVTPSDQDQLEGLLICFDNFVRFGITSVGDASVTSTRARLYPDAMKQGLSVRVNMMILDSYLTTLTRLKQINGFGNERLRIGSVKIFHGNSLSGRTCWLSEPYDMINPVTGKKDYYGIPPARSQEELDDLIYKCHKAGFQCAVHANGDREITMVLNAYEKALDRLPRKNHRHRIEHCSVADNNILRRVKKLGLVIAPHSYLYEHGDKMEEYGSKRWPMMHPTRSAIKLGIPVGGNSDYEVSAADPLLRIQSMVTRKSAEGKVYGPEQKVSVEQAIHIWTMGSAYASFEEDIKGSIEVGKLADFVILSKDPTRVPPDKIMDIFVETTVIGGKVVFELWN